MSNSLTKGEGYTVRYIYAVTEDGRPLFIQGRFACLADARKWVDGIRRCQDMRGKRESRLRRFFERFRSRRRKAKVPRVLKVIELAKDVKSSFDAFIRYRNESGALRRHMKRGFGSQRERDEYVHAFLAALTGRSFVS